MNLNDTILPQSVIAALYSKSLVSLPGEPLNEATSVAPLKILGSNQKHVTVLVSEAESRFISDKSFNFLTGILKACKLDMSDIALINMAQSDNLQYLTINDTTNPTTVLLFGLSSGDIGLPLHFPEFQVQPFNGVTYLSAPSLDAIENDKTLKAGLWTCLKSIFQL